MRDASYTAPAPTSGLKICDECAGMPGRAQIPRAGARGARSPRSSDRRRRPRTRARRAAPFAASTSAARAHASSGAPDSSSSPSNTTVTFMRSSSPPSFSALERVQDDDVAALHVDDARAARRRIVQPLEALKRTARLEHRIEVPDEEYLGSGPRMLGDQVAGAMERRAVDPASREAERVELRPEHVADLTHAGEVHRAAVDVHDALEQRERFGVVRVDRASRWRVRSTSAMAVDCAASAAGCGARATRRRAGSWTGVVSWA